MICCPINLFQIFKTYERAKKNTKVKIISWQGTCMVHEKFTGKEEVNPLP